MGWNDGRSESTAIDRSAAFGADVAGNRWRRAADKAGAALVVNQLSADHRRYLELGGRGTGLGDGELNDGAERVLETDYNAQLWRGLSVAFDYQFVTHPGYNRDRGGASVVGFRVHVEEAVPVDRLFRGKPS